MPPRLPVKPRNSWTPHELRLQWINPTDILSLLLLVGGDVLQQALGQQSGDTFLTPVVFSFGWVAYAFTALLSAVGNDRLMPAPPASSSIVLSTKQGYARSNNSWILHRLLRDYERIWMPGEVRSRLHAIQTRANVPRAGLCISVFEASSRATAGVPKRDAYWYSGYAVAVTQLGIAAIPWIMWDNWLIFIITAVGTFLAFTSGSLPQWRKERWDCRRHSHKTFVLTSGNGAQHAIVIQGAGKGLDLEDLAGSDGKYASTWRTKGVFGALTLCWGALLLTVSGIRTQTWFLLAIGAIGMIHTVIIAGAPRRPEWFGIHLEYKRAFIEFKVMAALQAAEEAYPGVGSSMLPTFFPGPLRDSEKSWWEENAIKNELKERDLDRRRQTSEHLVDIRHNEKREDEPLRK